MEQAVRRRRVLIVEDEELIAMLLEDMLGELGCDVAGRAASLSEALDAVADDTLDAAVLDIDLKGEMSFPAASALQRAGVPFLFVTGYAREGIPAAFAAVPVVSKPYQSPALAAALDAAFARRAV